MSKCLAVLALCATLSMGCDMFNKDKSDDTSGEPKKMSVDDCTHCTGNQTARADGTCPECKMKVK